MNELKQKAAFVAALDSYKPSAAAMTVLEQSRLVLLVGPTSSGKNTIINRLVASGNYYHIVTDTTRQIRYKDGQPIEKNGREYWFKTEDEMLAGLRNGDYVEAAILHGQQVSGFRIKELEIAIEANKIAVKDIDPVGAESVHQLKPNSTAIFILPPSFEVWMNRLTDRGGMSEEETTRRLTTARRELTAALTHDYYHLVINDNLNQAVERVQTIVNSGELDQGEEQEANKLARSLDEAIAQHLKE